MGYQFFLPMVLRWRASRAEAPLTDEQMEVELATIKRAIIQTQLSVYAKMYFPT